MAKKKANLNKTNSSGWLDDYSEEFSISEYADGGIVDAIKEFFTETINKPKPKSTPAKSSPKTFKIEDKRKVLATSGQPIRPNVDITSGEYDLEVLKGIIESAKRKKLPIEDVKNLAAIAFQETKFGKEDENLGHVLEDLTSRSDLEALTNAYITKMKEADRLGIKDDATRLQVYNGLGVVKPSTEQGYHGFKMKKIYGVPVPSTGINMKKNPLYGKQVMDLRDNVLNQNPEYVKYLNTMYNSKDPVPVYSDIELKSWGPAPLLKKFEMGGEVNDNFSVDQVTEIPIMKDGGKHGGLDRWFAEKWIDVKTGKECGRQKGEKRKGYPACRPSKRISSDTPKTASELSSAEKAKFKREKTSSERIDYNHKKEDGGLIYNDMKNKFKKYPAGGYLDYQEGYKGFGVGPELYQDNSYFRSVMPDTIENMEEQINQPSVFSGINDVLGSVNQGVNQITGLMSNMGMPKTGYEGLSDDAKKMFDYNKLLNFAEGKTGSNLFDTDLESIAGRISGGMSGDGTGQVFGGLPGGAGSKGILQGMSLLSQKNGGYLSKYQDGGSMDMLPVGDPEYIHKSNVFHENYNPVPRVHFTDDTTPYDMGVNLNDLVNMNGGRIGKYQYGGGLAGIYGDSYGNVSNSPRVFNASSNRASLADLQAANANDFLNTKVRKDRQSFQDDKVDWGAFNFLKEPVGAYLGIMSTVPILGDVTKDIVGDSFLTRTGGYTVGRGVGNVTSGAAKVIGGVATGNIGMVGQGIGDVGEGVGSTVGTFQAKDALSNYDKSGYISGNRMVNASQDFGNMMDTASGLFGNIKGGVGMAKNMGGLKGMMGNMKGGATGMKGFGNIMSSLSGIGFQDGGMIDYMYEDIQEFGKGGLTPTKAKKMLHDKSFTTDKQRKYFGYISSQKKTSGGWLDEI